MWWRAMRCKTGHGVVDALGSQAQHVRGMLCESWGTFGRSWAVMWCLGMRHFASWWMTVVCVGLSSFGASIGLAVGPGPSPGGRVCVPSRWVCRAVSLGGYRGAFF